GARYAPAQGTGPATRPAAVRAQGRAAPTPPRACRPLGNPPQPVAAQRGPASSSCSHLSSAPATYGSPETGWILAGIKPRSSAKHFLLLTDPTTVLLHWH